MRDGQASNSAQHGGKKLYAVRDARGRFKDLQTYQRAHSMDIQRSSKAERAKKKK